MNEEQGEETQSIKNSHDVVEKDVSKEVCSLLSDYVPEVAQCVAYLKED